MDIVDLDALEEEPEDRPARPRWRPGRRTLAALAGVAALATVTAGAVVATRDPTCRTMNEAWF